MTIDRRQRDLLVLYLIGSQLFSITHTIRTNLAAQFLGGQAIVSISIAANCFIIASYGCLICTVIQSLIPNRITCIIALGIEVLSALIGLLLPSRIVRVFYYGGEIDSCILALRSASIALLVGTAITAFVGYTNVLNNRFVICLIVEGAISILSIAVNWLFTVVFSMGIGGLAYGYVFHPVMVLLPIMAYREIDPADQRTIPKQQAQEQTYSYLDEYKRTHK